MRRIASTISLFAVIEALGILISLGFSADANSNATNGSCFTVSGSIITDYKVGDNCGPNVIIPSTINGTTIKEIGNNAFSNKELTSINIPNSIEKIGSSAFSNNKLTDLVLPNSVSEVGYGAFAWNEGIKQITLSENMETLPDSFCNGCNVRKLRNGIPNKMKKIGKAFNARSTYGNTTYLGWTFYDMEKMEIPSSVEEITNDAFGTITFSNFDIKSKNINIGTIYSINSTVKLNITKGATVKYSINNIPGHWSSSFSDPTSVSIKSLEDDGAAVNFIVSGDLVVYQPVAVGFKKGDYAVYPKDIVLTGYEIDGRYYKDRYYNDVDFDIKNTPLTEDITLYAKLKELPCWEFTLTDENNKEVEVKKYRIEYPHCINWYNENYENFAVPSTVPSDLEYAGYKVIGIGDMAFCNEEYQNGMGIIERSFVSHITIPNTVKYIGAKSFKKGSLESIVLPNSIEHIGEQAFFGNGLKNITWSENLKGIGSNAFAYSSLKSTKFPDSLKVIGSAAFHESQLSQIEFGSGSQLESIGYLAFGYSDPYNGPQYGNIKKITFPKSLKSIENRAFYNNKVEEITLLCDSCTIYQNAFQIEGRNDRQIPGYKRKSADIKNYDLHLVLTDIVETYKITLDSDGATNKGTENLRYDFGTPMYYLDKEKTNTIDGGITIPGKEGYSFQGYFTEKNGNGLKYISNLGVIGKIYTIDSDTILYASWKKDEEQDNTHNAAGTDCDGLSNPKREGYKFIGWYTDRNYTKLYNPNELFTGELTLYSKWEREGGNSGTEADSNQGDDGSDDSNDSSDDGSIDDNNDNTSNNDNNIKNSVTYSVKHFTETLTGSYTLLSTETLTAESGSKVTPPVKKFKGYKSPNTKTITVKGDGTSVVEYRYSRELFEITLNKGEGIQTVAGGGSYRFGTKVSLSATPVPGYEFVGFEGDQTTGSFTMPSNNITITAKAKKGNTKYSISYNLNKGKLEQGKTNPTSYSSSSPSFTINPPVRNEYVFAGWEETVNGKVTGIKTYVSIPQGSTGHRKYSAKWKKEGEVEEMIYNQQEDLEGNYVTVEVIASEGDGDSDSGNGNTNGPKEYEGFHLVEDFSKQNNIDQGAIGEVLELGSNGPATIIYRYARNSYTLTIEKDAGIELVQGAGTYKYQEPVSIKVKVKDGYQFAGFEGEYNVANFEMPAKNLTIKAITTKRK